MTLEEIKAAVTAGQCVYVGNKNYTVTVDSKDQWYIKCIGNGSLIGLTWMDGKTLNAKESDFFV